MVNIEMLILIAGKSPSSCHHYFFKSKSQLCLQHLFGIASYSHFNIQPYNSLQPNTFCSHFLSEKPHQRISISSEPCKCFKSPSCPTFQEGDLCHSLMIQKQCCGVAPTSSEGTKNVSGFQQQRQKYVDMFILFSFTR